MGAWLACLSLLLAAVLTGCSAPVGVAVPTGVTSADAVPMTARVAFGYRLQATLKAYTAADVDHVKLVLLADDGGWRETGATKAVAAAALASPVALGNLRAGTRYRLRAEAYSAADESSATCISDLDASTTDFATPAVTPTNGVDSIDDAAVAVVALRCKLLDRTYAGTGSFKVAVSKGLDNKLTHVRLTLSQVAADGTLTTRHTRTVALADAGQTFTMTNLRAGQAYRLLAEGVKVATAETKLSNDNQSTLTFTTPAVSGDQIDESVAASAYTVACK